MRRAAQVPCCALAGVPELGYPLGNGNNGGGGNLLIHADNLKG